MTAVDSHGTYVVECYWPAVTVREHERAADRARMAAARTTGQGRKLEFLGSILIPAEETVFCLFAGSEADARAASRRAGLPLERVLASIPSGLRAPGQG